MSTTVCDTDRKPAQPDAATADELTTVLVVDDTRFDRELVRRILKSMGGLRVLLAADGVQAWAMIESEAPAIVLTDLIMPEMGGLDLVQKIRSLYHRISVILMTANGSEDVAMQALRAGAANYIPKRDLVRDLVPTLRKILAITRSRRERNRVLGSLVRRESDFVLDNDPELIVALVTLLSEELEGVGIQDATAVMQMCIALQESLSHAMYRGTLEIGAEVPNTNERGLAEPSTEYDNREPVRSRSVRVHAQIDRESARFLVADDGPGYKTSLLNEPVQTRDINRISGRGLLLIRTFMDEVVFNETGNQITMVKRGSPPDGA
jgi:CheY-like chemotaxis protein